MKDRGNEERGSTVKVESYIPSTGEVLDGVFVYIPKKSRLGGFVMLFQEALSAMAGDRRMTLSSFRVRDALIGHLDFENYILINSKAVAESIDMKPSNFSREVTKLVEMGLLIRGPRNGNSTTLRLNPSFGWRGKARGHEAAKHGFRKESASRLTVIDGGRSILPPVVEIDREAEPELPFDPS
jgi:hypothetical protein